ncbi:MAG TPA: hypothetical protein VD860_17100 [Azospirillum sp.]|nr:hypothetical protein [Azospirillum sp.]
MKAVAAVATPASDRKLAKEYRTKGALARKAGEPRENAPNGLIGRWWLEGYDTANLVPKRSADPD